MNWARRAGGNLRRSFPELWRTHFHVALPIVLILLGVAWATGEIFGAAEDMALTSGVEKLSLTLVFYHVGFWWTIAVPYFWFLIQVRRFPFVWTSLRANAAVALFAFLLHGCLAYVPLCFTAGFLDGYAERSAILDTGLTTQEIHRVMVLLDRAAKPNELTPYFGEAVAFAWCTLKPASEEETTLICTPVNGTPFLLTSDKSLYRTLHRLTHGKDALWFQSPSDDATFQKCINDLDGAELREALHAFKFRGNGVLKRETRPGILFFLETLCGVIVFLAGSTVSLPKRAVISEITFARLASVLRRLPSLRLRLSRTYPELWALRLHDLVKATSLCTFLLLLCAAVYYLLARLETFFNDATLISATSGAMTTFVTAPLVGVFIIVAPLWAARRQQHSIAREAGFRSFFTLNATMAFVLPPLMVMLAAMWLSSGEQLTDPKRWGYTSYWLVCYASLVTGFLILNRFGGSRVSLIFIAGCFAWPFVVAVTYWQTDSPMAPSIVLPLIIVAAIMIMPRTRSRNLQRILRIGLVSLLPILYTISAVILFIVDNSRSWLILDAEAFILLAVWGLLLAFTAQATYELSLQPS